MLARLQQIAVARALSGRGGSHHWVAITAAVWLLRKAHEVRQLEHEVVYRQVLEPGQTLVIDHTLLDRRGKPARLRRRR